METFLRILVIVNLSLNKLSRHFCSLWDKPGWLHRFWQIHCDRLSSLNPKGFQYSYGWPPSLREERASFCTGLISRKLCRLLLMFSNVLLHSMSHFFFLYRSPSLLLCTVFDPISSNIDQVLSINPSANVFIFGDFNAHHKDCLTFSGGADRSAELCYNFSISNDLTQIVNFPTRIPDCWSHSPALLDLFISCDASICSTMAFPPLGNS